MNGVTPVGIGLNPPAQGFALSSGPPTPPAPADSDFVLSGAVPADLTNSRELVSTATVVRNLATPGQIGLDIDPAAVAALLAALGLVPSTSQYVNGTIAYGGGFLISRTLMNHAAILNSFTTPIQITPTPAANEVHIPRWVHMSARLPAGCTWVGAGGDPAWGAYLAHNTTNAVLGTMPLTLTSGGAAIRRRNNMAIANGTPSTVYGASANGGNGYPNYAGQPVVIYQPSGAMSVGNANDIIEVTCGFFVVPLFPAS